MKKTIRTILCAAVLAVLSVSCQKETEGVESMTDIKETIEISVNGLMGEYTQVDATKASLVNTIRVAWEGGESVYVYDGTTYLGSLTSMLEGDDNRYAILSGTIGAPAGNKLFLLYSPLLTEAPAIDDGKLSVSLAEQNTSKAPFVVFATLDYTCGDITGAIVPFTFATSAVRVSCIGLEPKAAISSAKISNVNTHCVLSFANGTVTASGAEEGTITRTNADGFAEIQVNAEGDACFQVAVPALSSSTGRTLTIMQGGNEYVDKKFSTSSINPNLSVNTICTMVSISQSSPIGTIGVIDGRKAIVVNLNGAKYAVALMNEGATSESGSDSYGAYYDFKEASKFFHDTDLNIWRVPTMNEMKALTDMNPEYEKTTPGFNINIEDNPILFPMAGLCSEENPSEVGVTCNYYTSTHYESGGETFCTSMCAGLFENEIVVNYIGAPTTLFKYSIRLFYQLTEVKEQDTISD